MKSKLRLVAASLALLLGISGAAFAQPVGYNRNTRNETSYRGYANTSAWGYQNGREEQDRAYQRTNGDRDDRGYQVRRDDDDRSGNRQLENGWHYRRDRRDQREGRNQGNHSWFHRRADDRF